MSSGSSFQGSGKRGFCLGAMLHPSKPTGIFSGHKCYFHCSKSLERRYMCRLLVPESAEKGKPWTLSGSMKE